MAGILLSILSVIGHILLAALKVVLIILLVLLILILLLLFTPFSYRGDVHRHGDKFYGTAGLSWLGIVLRLSACFGDGANRVELYLFGIPLLKLIRGIRGRRSGSHEVKPSEAAEKKPAAVPEENQSGTRSSRENTGEEQGKNAEGRHLPGKKKKKRFEGRHTSGGSRSRVNTIYDKIKYGLGILRSEEYKGAFDEIKRRGLKMIRHVAPKKIAGIVEFGFDDPAYTGMALGALSWILPVIPEGLCITPDFTEKKLEADVKARGRFFLIVLLKEGLGLLLNQEVKNMIRSVRRGRQRQ